jgi:hypothetical protein
MGGVMSEESIQTDDNDGIGPSGIVWHNVKVRAGDLVEWERNPRTITDEQAKHLAKSFIKFGYVDPIQINTDHMIVGGHMRYRVMLQAKMITMDTMIDVRMASRTLEPDEFEELAVRLNKNTGKWDFDKLAQDFDQTSLREWGFSPMEFGMTSVDMKASKLQPAKGEKVCPACGAVLP